MRRRRQCAGPHAPDRHGRGGSRRSPVAAGAAVAAVLGVLGVTACSAAPHARPAPSAPATAPAASPAASPAGPAFPLHTDGARIVDAHGAPVILAGVNWFGAETDTHVPHGLWRRDIDSMLSQIRSLGFTTVRLPFSRQAWTATTTKGIDATIGANATIKSMSPREVMDVIVDTAAAKGLMLILDNHSLRDNGNNWGLWYGQDGVTEADWIAMWTDIARRYRTKPNVIGYDLKNEPHRPATWGDGAATDWRGAAERAGAAIQAVDPSKLIIVEGISDPVAGGQRLTGSWWGGNLEGVRNNPVRLPVPDKVVYSPHEYGPGVFPQKWFAAPDPNAVLATRWTDGFGFIADAKIAPVFVGEFGGRETGTDTAEGRWMRQFADYLGRTGTSWAFWSWNPNSRDTGGILNDDWTTTNQAKVALLQELQARRPIAFRP